MKKQEMERIVEDCITNQSLQVASVGAMSFADKKKRPLKAVLADNNVQDRESREKAMEDIGMHVVCSTGDGKKAFDAIERESPDIVVLDMILPGLDGIGILEEMNHLNMIQKPVVVIVTALKMSHIVEEALKSGADYYMMKPISNRVFVKRLIQISEGAPTQERPHHEATRAVSLETKMPYAATREPRIGEQIRFERKTQPLTSKIGKSLREQGYIFSGDLEMDVTNVLLEIGIPAHIKGYQYIREGIILAFHDRNMLQYITKYLYPTIAKKYQTSSSSVERTIRHAIEVAWQRGNLEILEDVFGNTVCAGRGKPTNSEFLALLTDKFRLEYRSRSVS